MKRTIVTWGVEEKKGKRKQVTLSFTLWKTRKQAVEGYTQLTGKSWDELKKEGAQLVKKSAVVAEEPGKPPPTN